MFARYRAAEGWRTGPSATLLVFFLEYCKLLLPWCWWRVLAHGILGWLLFPLRYHLLIVAPATSRPYRPSLLPLAAQTVAVE